MSKERMKIMKKTIKKILSVFVLPIPVLLHVILFKPYWWMNKEYLVDRFGCGCDSGFNANDFTIIFWHCLLLGTTVLSIFLSKCITADNKWVRIALRIFYIVVVTIVSFALTNNFIYIMMWD